MNALRENSLYYRAYLEPRRVLIDMLFHGVRWDREEAERERERLAKRRDEIKKEIFEISKVPLWTETPHRSDEILALYDWQRRIKTDYGSIPKTDRTGRKAYKPVVDGIAEAIRECKDSPRAVSITIGDGLSDDKIAAYLYETLKIPAFKKRRKGTGKTTVTVDDTALKKIKLRFPDHRALVDLIIEHRRCQKLISTYLNPEKLLSPLDGRFHSHYMTFGTQTLRLASKSDPDDCGGNSQNQDREFKWLFLPDKD